MYYISSRLGNGFLLVRSEILLLSTRNRICRDGSNLFKRSSFCHMNSQMLSSLYHKITTIAASVGWILKSKRPSFTLITCDKFPDLERKHLCALTPLDPLGEYCRSVKNIRRTSNLNTPPTNVCHE